MDCHRSAVASGVVVVVALLFGTLINASPAYVGRPSSFPLTPAAVATAIVPVQSTAAAAAAAPIWGASRTEVLRDAAEESESESSSSASADAFAANLETPTIVVTAAAAASAVRPPHNADAELFSSCQAKCIAMVSVSAHPHIEMRIR